MSVRPVGLIATFVSGIFTKPYLIRNSGTTTVYVGQDSSLTVATRAISMPPGSTLNWSGDTELWAIGTAAGELELLYTGENAFTPGPTTVGISGPVDVSGSSVGVSGNVGITGANGVLFGPSAPALSPNSLNFVGSFTNLTGYNSLVITIGNSTTIGNAANLNNNVLILNWCTPGGDIIAQDYPEYSITGQLIFTTPIKGALLNVYIQTQASTFSIPVMVTATSVALPRSYKHKFGLTSQATNFNTPIMQSNVDAGWLDFTGTTNAPNGTQVLNSKSGPAVVMLNGPSNSTSFITTSDGIATRIAPIAIPAGTTESIIYATIFPEKPVIAKFPLTTSGYHLNILWQIA